MKMEKANLLKVRAEICVERESQKGIVIGKGAQMIKTIRVESIKTARKILEYPLLNTNSQRKTTHRRRDRRE